MGGGGWGGVWGVGGGGGEEHGGQGAGGVGALGGVGPAYVSVFLQEMQSVLIDSQDAGGVDRGGATAVDVEEGGAKHGEGTNQTCTHTHTHTHLSV